jgi:hypothetical protein
MIHFLFPYFISKLLSEMLLIHVQVEVIRFLTAILAGDFKLLMHLVGTLKHLHYIAKNESFFLVLNFDFISQSCH